MSEAEKAKEDWYNILIAINSVLELEQNSETSEVFSMLLKKKSTIEKEVSKYYKIVQLTTFRLEPLN